MERLDSAMVVSICAMTSSSTIKSLWGLQLRKCGQRVSNQCARSVGLVSRRKLLPQVVVPL
jgi:hypothetical protein